MRKSIGSHFCPVSHFAGWETEACQAVTYTLEWSWRIRMKYDSGIVTMGVLVTMTGKAILGWIFTLTLTLLWNYFPLLSFSFRLKLELSCAPVSLEDNHAQSPWWPFDRVSHPSSAKSKRLTARINSSVTVVRYSTSIFRLLWNYWVPAKAKREKSLPTISTGSGVLLCSSLPRHSGVKLQLSRHNPLDQMTWLMCSSNSVHIQALS